MIMEKLTEKEEKGTKKKRERKKKEVNQKDKDLYVVIISLTNARWETSVVIAAT